MQSFTIPEIVTNMGGDKKKVRDALERFLSNPHEVEAMASRVGDIMNRHNSRDQYMDIDRLTAFHILRATGAITISETRTSVPPETHDNRQSGGGSNVHSHVAFNEAATAELKAAMGRQR